MPSQLGANLKSDWKQSFDRKNFGKFTESLPSGGVPNGPSDPTSTHDAPMHISSHTTVADGVIAKDCHIGHEAKVLDTAHVEGSSILHQAVVYGDATVRNSRMTEGANVGQNAVVEDCGVYSSTRILGQAKVERSHLYGMVLVDGRAVVQDAKLRNKVHITGSARVSGGEIIDQTEVVGDSIVENSTVAGQSLISGSKVKHCKLDNVVLCHGIQLEGFKKSKVWYCGLESGSTPGKEYKDLSPKLFFKGKEDSKVLAHLQQDQVEPFDQAAGESPMTDIKPSGTEIPAPEPNPPVPAASSSVPHPESTREKLPPPAYGDIRQE